MLTTLGIDPGASGAYALLSGDRVAVWDQPTQQVGRGKGVKTKADIGSTFALLTALAPAGITLAVLEDVGGRPGQSAPAAFSFGRTAAIPECALTVAAIPFRMVPPATWKRHFKLLGLGKDEAIALASQIFPASRHLWTPLRGACTAAQAEGRAEAALLAVYARTLAI